MDLEVGPEALPTYLRAVRAAHPRHVTIRGTGVSVGKASWLALVLETEQGYKRTGLGLERIKRGDADLAQLTITLETCHGGAGKRLF
jgi:hypothetical protein